MTEVQMLGALLLVSASLGLVIALANYRKWNGKKWYQIVMMYAIYTGAEYFLICFGRVLLLLDDEFYTWNNNFRLAFLDIGWGIVGIFILPYLIDFVDCRKAMLTRIICGCAVFVVPFVYQYCIYRNINSSIYHMLLPRCIVVVCVVCWLIDCLINYTKQEVDKGQLYNTISVTVLFVTTVIICPFLDTYISNISEFSFEFKDVIIPLVVFSICVFVLSIELLNKSNRLYNGLILAVFGFSLASYIQEMFLNKQLFLMDGTYRNWDIKSIIINLIIWGIVFFVLKLIDCKKLYTPVSFLLSAMQIVGVISLLITNAGLIGETNVIENYFSTDGLNEIANDDNIIIFVLDKYDEKFMQEVLDSNENFLEPLEGFTYYNDCVAQFSRTYPSITYMLTDNTFFEENNRTDYVNNAFEKCSFWNGLSDEGYSLYFYEEDSSYLGQSIKDKALNYVEKGECLKREISVTGVIRSIYMMNAYKIMPYLVKDYFMYTAEYVNDNVVTDAKWKKSPYYLDDAEFNELIKNEGLVISNDNKAFRFIHMFGAHPPYSLDEMGNRVNSSKNWELSQYIGSMKIIYNYLDELKLIGKYKDSTIIITADHGDNYENGDVLPENTNIILFIKPKGVDSGELVYSSEYASQSDILTTISGIYDLKYNTDDGIDLLSDIGMITNNSRERYHYFHVVENTVQTSVRKYVIKGNSLDFNNWNATDEYYEWK
jgi:hypothetical protein